PAPRRPARRPAAALARVPARERSWRKEEPAFHEPLEADAVEVEEVEEIAELAEIGDDDEEITPTPSVPEEEESEW
ncbi:MAG: hypothetical protein M3542_02025, partial [Acidobacteriota bacterium]|nr:hypothetical protein [Acidobacteriota bacterium]